MNAPLVILMVQAISASVAFGNAWNALAQLPLEMQAINALAWFPLMNAISVYSYASEESQCL